MTIVYTCSSAIKITTTVCFVVLRTIQAIDTKNTAIAITTNLTMNIIYVYTILGTPRRPCVFVYYGSRRSIAFPMEIKQLNTIIISIIHNADQNDKWYCRASRGPLSAWPANTTSMADGVGSGCQVGRPCLPAANYIQGQFGGLKSCAGSSRRGMRAPTGSGGVQKKTAGLPCLASAAYM